jgi:TnpA family transposase
MNLQFAKLCKMQRSHETPSDGLLMHGSTLSIHEHYTDTAGATDHVFGMCHLLGFRFAPRVRDLKERRLYVIDRQADYGPLMPLVGGPVRMPAEPACQGFA